MTSRQREETTVHVKIVLANEVYFNSPGLKDKKR